MLARIARRLRDERGFGLIEMAIALTMLAIGISALGGLFVTGNFALRRASKSDTAAVLADKLLERFRAETWSTISLSSTLVASADTTYKSDSAYSSTLAITDSSGPCSGTNVPVACNPSRGIPDTTQTPIEVAPDGQSYRLDTYVNWACSDGSTPSGSGPSCSSGGLVKSVTIVVRDATSAATLAGAPLFRITSTFDRLTGGSMPAVTVSGTTTGATTTTGTTTTTPGSAPSAPTAVSFVNGGGAGSTYIDSGNATSLSFDVTLPSTSLPTDTITLVVGDGDGVNDVQATASGTSGAGVVHFTGINGQVWADGQITVTATAKNSNGTSAATTTTVTKDTTVPDAPTTVALANGQGSGNAYINSSNVSAVSIGVGLDGNSQSTDTVKVTLSDGSSTTNPVTTSATSGSGTVTLTGISASALANGSVTASASVVDAAGNISPAATTTIAKDAAAPAATITLGGTSPTNGTSVTWSVSFSKSVSGVSASSFSLAKSGLSGTPAITGVVANSGSSYTVTASTGTGSGTLGLNLGSGSAVTDSAGNTANASTGPVYTIDRTPPTATISLAGSSPTNASSLQWTVTFSESVSGVSTANFSTNPSAGVTGTSVTGVTANSSTSYTVTVNAGSGDGTLGVNLSSPSSVKDTAGNSASSATGAVYTVDRTAPTLSITSPTNGASGFSGGGPFTGTASDTTTVTIQFCQAATWTCGTTPTQTATTSVTGGTWSLSLSGSAKLANNKSYAMRVKQTDAAGNTGTSADRLFHT